MSMIGNLLRVTKSELEEYLGNSSLLEERVYSEEYIEDPNLLDLDKAWEGIYFLLTGHSSSDFEEAEPPLSLILFNGEVVDEDQDIGYGPATYCSPEEVKEISDTLSKISSNDLQKKFEELKNQEPKLYPFSWDSDDTFDYLSEYYVKMKEFYRLASENNQAVISFIN